MPARILTACRVRAAVATLGSAALLGGALAYQHLGGLLPCEMCVIQRWPHAIAIVIGVLTVVSGSRGLAVLGGLVMLASVALGVAHAGYEQHWWELPLSCSGAGTTDLASGDLMAQIMDAPVVRCDEITWTFLDLSMAAWNAIGSFVLMLLWFSAAASHRARR